MKGHEIINHIVRDEMPDMEEVRSNCHRQFAFQGTKNTMRLKRLAPVAAAFVMLVVISTTVLAYAGGFDWFIQRFNPRFAGVVEPVMAYAEDKGLRITIVGAQSFGSTAVVYLSVAELTEENRLTECMDWWPGLHLYIEGLGGGMAQSLLYFDTASTTAYLEVRFAASEEIPHPMTLVADRLALYPAQAVTGNWSITAYTQDIASQHVVAVVQEFMLCDVILIERMVLTPLGLTAEGTFATPSDDNFMSPLAAQHEVYIETPGGLLPLISAGGGIFSYSAHGLFDGRPMICRGCYPSLLDGNPMPVSVAEMMEMSSDIRVTLNWETAAPIDVADAAAIIINGLRVPMTAS